jgi:hypothetical protein
MRPEHAHPQHGAEAKVRGGVLRSGRNTNFSATCKSIYTENTEEKACRVNRSNPKLRRETAVQREIFRIVPVSTNPKPDAQNRPEPRLFRGPNSGGECLARDCLERAKGFEPSTPTLATMSDPCEVVAPERIFSVLSVSTISFAQFVRLLGE